MNYVELIRDGKLRYQRELRGWGQERLAKAVGVSTKTISRWERGETLPYPFYGKRLENIFDKGQQA
jgi:Predicted transcriptional regulators